MKILIEGYAYDPEVVRNALPGNHLFLTKNKINIEYVGYYHNARSTKEGNDDFVFFLPKVVLNKDNRVFVTRDNPLGFAPEEIVDPDNVKTSDGRALDERQREFLYDFSVWIYRALAYYLETHSDTEAVWYCNDGQSGAFKRKYVTNTFLDVILALIRFNRENQDYFLFKIKEKHSGLNKISWPRTIAHSQALIDDGVPVYLDPVNKKRTIDYDEELLVLFYSILSHIHSNYKFRVKIGLGYQLITGDRFKRYLDGYGVARLRQIKYKYYSDRDLMLWGLCFAFFDKAHQANVSATGEDYLLAKSFDRVFEAMVDELIGDPELSRYKDLDDGKEIDHLYIDKSITRTDEWQTLCIADSKYYKIGNALEKKSQAKQFTYARDMLQLDLDLFLYEPGEGDENLTASLIRRRETFKKSKLRLLRDDVTEGYDIIPNFFISATMNEDFDYDVDDLRHRHADEGREYHNIHFDNRLFDRDTLILSHFDVNFLYILKLYVQNDDADRAAWRAVARTKFRDEIRSLISKRYDLHALMPHEGVDAQQFFRENFKYTGGKVYSPYPEDGGVPVYALALQKASDVFDDGRLSETGRNVQVDRVRKENADVLQLVETAFYVKRNVPFGHDPRPELLQMAEEHPVTHGAVADDVSGVQVVSKIAGPLTAAVDSCLWCPCPVDQCVNPDAVRTLVIPYTQGAHLYRVVVGFEIKKNLDAEAISVEFGDAFDRIRFPSSTCHFWKVEKIA